ncbi:MAG TPA: VanZ family protein [Candidatus Saccharimonadales bacterium]
MFGFLSSFSTSFIAALLAWPFLAALLTLPILIAQYRRYNKFLFGRAVMTYLFVLFSLGLISFTLYPMPDNPAEFCKAYALSPQLIPFNFIADIQTEGQRAILQIVMNIIFFLPLGVFARILFRWKILPTILLSLGLSLAIETAQLTGIFGIYPCSYRLFDVDDLLFNTFGGIGGYVLAMAIPRRELEKAEKNATVRHAGLLRYAVAFIIDQMLVVMSFIFVILGVYFVFGNEVALTLRDMLYLVVFLTIHTFIPYLSNGWSIGGRFVRLNHDDKKRSTVQRLLFYTLRTLFIGIFTFPFDGGVPLLAVLLLVAIWYKWKRLPYQFV